MLATEDILQQGDIKVRVTGIKDGKAIVNGKSDEEVGGAPISKEFLRRNKWKQDEERCYWTIGNEFNGAKLQPIQDEWILTINNGEYHFQGWINFIHELQHAFDICRIDKYWRI